jgi:hypothetical protein
MPGFRGTFRSEQYYYHDRKPCVKYFRKNTSMANRIHNVPFVHLFTLYCMGRILALGFLDMLIVFLWKGSLSHLLDLHSAMDDDKTGRYRILYRERTWGYVKLILYSCGLFGFLARTNSGSRTFSARPGVPNHGMAIGLASSSSTGSSGGGAWALLSPRDEDATVAGGASRVPLTRAKVSRLSFSKSDFCFSSSWTRQTSRSLSLWRSPSF